MMVIPMPICKDYHIINHRRDTVSPETVYMTWISDEEELKIDKQQTIKLERGKRIFVIQPRQIFCYGIIDFDNDSEDMEELDNMSFFDHLIQHGQRIPSNYDYKTHTCTSPKKFPMLTETWSCADYAKYAHGCLDKPKSVVIFKVVHDGIRRT